ncbi:MAG TPA: alpha/beta hydrolase [Bryobacteraceae bacterium]|nr:alpha/beta hydrolase [Bryobacteraceae bacterium]
MRRNWTGVLTIAMTGALAAGAATVALAQDLREVETRRDMTYATHDGAELKGDYYVPKAAGKYPVTIAVHGGGWEVGSKTAYRYWGPYLAQRGIALYAIDYRLAKPDRPSYPGAVQDIRAAIQFVKSKAADLKADPEHVGLIGDSAGSHLVALTALAADKTPFAGAYPGDPYPNVSAAVKAVVAAYGVYDMAQQWNHDQLSRPRDNIAEKFLGKAPMDDRRLYFEASPMSYATRANNQTSFLLTWGTADDIVDPHQSEAFILALKQAEFFVRPVPVQAAPHFWMGDPLDDPRGNVTFAAPQILRFLQTRL